MQLQVILNRVQRHRGFVYKKAKLVEKSGGLVVEVDIEPRSNSRAICSGCGRTGPGYDRERTPRRFQFVPLWGMAVFFLYTCLLYTSPSPRDGLLSRMPSSA